MTDPLSLASPPDDPFEFVALAYRRAEAERHLAYPNAMCLSTVSPEGRPEGRFVIVESFGPEGFVFLTDVRSAKARALAGTPLAALTVYWGAPLEIQLRVDGRVEKAPDALADELFHHRPRRSQATPWASCQSEPTTLAALEKRLAEADAAFAGREELPRPDTWRAYRLVPETIEIWRARPRRLHDRFRYTCRPDGGWDRERLAP